MNTNLISHHTPCLTSIEIKKPVVKTHQPSKLQTATRIVCALAVAMGLGCLVASTRDKTTSLSNIPVRHLPRVSGICPVTDPFHHYNIANYLSGHITQHVHSLTEQARMTSYDTYRKPDGTAFRYGINQGQECLRREWGETLSQFDSLTPLNNDGFEFKRNYEGRTELMLRCIKDKNKLSCSSSPHFNGMKYNAHEDKNEIVEELCIKNVCEKVTSPKNQATPLLLNKLLHITNKA